jgi:hypothetical protein
MVRTNWLATRLRVVGRERLVLKIGMQECPHCCRSEIYVSRPESIGEEMMILLLLRPVRCRGCMARFYRPLWVPTPPKGCVGRSN